MIRDFLEIDVASLHSLKWTDPDDCSRSIHKDNINTHSDIEGKCSETQEESSTRSRRIKMNRDCLEVDAASLHALVRSDPDDCSRSVRKDNINAQCHVGCTNTILSVFHHILICTEPCRLFIQLQLCQLGAPGCFSGQ